LIPAARRTPTLSLVEQTVQPAPGGSPLLFPPPQAGEGQGGGCADAVVE